MSSTQSQVSVYDGAGEHLVSYRTVGQLTAVLDYLMVVVASLVADIHIIAWLFPRLPTFEPISA
jgi:hypothetical protein